MSRVCVGQVEPFVARLREGGSRVSLFIEPSLEQVDAAEAMGAPVVEFHTGKYVELFFAGDAAGAAAELQRLQGGRRPWPRQGHRDPRRPRPHLRHRSARRRDP